MKETLEAAVIGAGHFGRHHARIYSELPDVRLGAVVDIDSERAGRVAKATGALPSTDYRDLVGRVDLVSVVTPPPTHYQIARDFLVGGAAVLVEKPMTATVTEAERLVAVAEEHNAVLQVGFVNRFSPVLRALSGLDVRPRFIEVHRLCPFNFRAADVGVVLDMMIHDIDLVTALVPSPVARVEAVGFGVVAPTEDIANARITFEDGCVANLTASRVAFQTMRRVRIFSPDSYVSLDFDRSRAVLVRRREDFTAGDIELGILKETAPEELRALLFDKHFSLREMDLDDGTEPLKRELQSFISCARTGDEPVVSGNAALRTMRTAEQVLNSMGRCDWAGQFVGRSV